MILWDKTIFVGLLPRASGVRFKTGKISFLNVVVILGALFAHKSIMGCLAGVADFRKFLPWFHHLWI